jgi:hypothetical protein
LRTRSEGADQVSISSRGDGPSQVGDAWEGMIIPERHIWDSIYQSAGLCILFSWHMTYKLSAESWVAMQMRDQQFTIVSFSTLFQYQDRYPIQVLQTVTGETLQCHVTPLCIKHHVYSFVAALSIGAAMTGCFVTQCACTPASAPPYRIDSQVLQRAQRVCGAKKRSQGAA